MEMKSRPDLFVSRILLVETIEAVRIPSANIYCGEFFFQPFKAQ